MIHIPGESHACQFGTLHCEVRDLFADPSALEAARAAGNVENRASSHDKCHGRIEECLLTVTNHLEWMNARERRSWLGLRRLAHYLLKHDQSVKDSIAGKRKCAYLSAATLERFLKLIDPK